LYIAECVVHGGLLNKYTYYLSEKWSRPIEKSQGRKEYPTYN